MIFLKMCPYESIIKTHGTSNDWAFWNPSVDSKTIWFEI